MTDVLTNPTLRLGDRVIRRVTARIAGVPMWGDVIGTDIFVFSDDLVEANEKILVGWQDGSQSWELPIELRRTDA